jgi:threonine synthase
LLARYETEVTLAAIRSRPPGMWRYRELLPVSGDPVSLGEPETPLIFLPRLSERWGIETYVKDDSGLAGGTFKARGAAVGLSRAVELGVTSAVMPSAGNAGGAWALYAARAGMELTVTMAATAPAFNQAEVRAAGATLELVGGTIADAGRRAADIAAETNAFLVTTFSEPYRLEGKKTAWLEVFDRLGEWPRTVVLPVGGGVAAIALAKAAAEVHECGWATGERPGIIGVQPANCAPIVRAFESEADVEPWTDDPMTIAAGLRVPAPAEGALVLQTVRASGGSMVAVSEQAILAAVRDLASNEGVFACPEGATTVAATERLARDGALTGPVVLYNTGAGSKYSEVV